MALFPLQLWRVVLQKLKNKLYTSFSRLQLHKWHTFLLVNLKNADLVKTMRTATATSVQSVLVLYPRVTWVQYRKPIPKRRQWRRDPLRGIWYNKGLRHAARFNPQRESIKYNENCSPTIVGLNYVPYISLITTYSAPSIYITLWLSPYSGSTQKRYVTQLNQQTGETHNNKYLSMLIIFLIIIYCTIFLSNPDRPYLNVNWQFWYNNPIYQTLAERCYLDFFTIGPKSLDIANKKKHCSRKISQKLTTIWLVQH